MSLHPTKPSSPKVLKRPQESALKGLPADFLGVSRVERSFVDVRRENIENPHSQPYTLNPTP